MKLYEIISVFSYTLSKLIPKKKDRWIFGSWFGNAASDNTKGLYDYLSQNYPEIEKIWILNEPEKSVISGAKVVKRNSFESLKYILTAEVAVMNQGFGDFCAVNLLGGSYKVQLWHGVAWKKIVRDARTEKNVLKNKIFNYNNSYDLYIAPSEKYKEVVKSAFGAKEKQILLCGQPRNEVLFDEAFCEKCHEDVLRMTSQTDKKIVVYMPTFRDNTDDVFSFCKPEAAAFWELAQKYNFIIVEKSHFKSIQRNKKTDSVQNQFVFTMPNVDANTLLGAADILITDYSSCFFDFLIRNKPIIHYVYDYAYYKNKDRGLYYEIEDVAAGNVAYDNDELYTALEDNIRNDNSLLRQSRIHQYITYEYRGSSEQIVKSIYKMLGKEI